MEDINGLVLSLNNKADAEHTHSGYAQSEHTHSKDDITGLIEYSAGDNITIDSDGKISATVSGGKEYTAGSGISISADGVISATSTGGTETVYQAGEGISISGETVSVDFSKVAAKEHEHSGYAITGHFHGMEDINGLVLSLNNKADSDHTHNATSINGLSTVATSGSYNDLTDKPAIPDSVTYTAGENISISDSGVISAVDTKYTAGTGIAIENGVISCTVEGGGSEYLAGSCIDITDNIVNLQIADERGFNVLNTGLSLNFEVIATQDDVFAVDQKVSGLQETVTDIGNSLGDINTILDEINGEVI
jgi:hypothetical protein